MHFITVKCPGPAGKNIWASCGLRLVRKALWGRMARPSWVGPNRDIIRVDCRNANDAVLARLAWP
ncbi:MAG TPA: hypothetical protein VGO55_11795 [Allosphingosinicella sp.]|nr:hypothetical protein [Allosphingosinicella sp.]